MFASSPERKPSDSSRDSLKSTSLLVPHAPKMLANERGGWGGGGKKVDFCARRILATENNTSPPTRLPTRSPTPGRLRSVSAVIASLRGGKYCDRVLRGGRGEKKGGKNTGRFSHFRISHRSSDREGVFGVARSFKSAGAFLSSQNERTSVQKTRQIVSGSAPSCLLFIKTRTD